MILKDVKIGQYRSKTKFITYIGKRNTIRIKQLDNTTIAYIFTNLEL